VTPYEITPRDETRRDNCLQAERICLQAERHPLGCKDVPLGMKDQGSRGAGIEKVDG
jgi:hypothetical protein